MTAPKPREFTLGAGREDHPRDKWLGLALRATGAVDRGYRAFTTARANMFVAFGTDSFFLRNNDRYYREQARYAPGNREQLTGLFRWELQAIERFLPAPPARLLVGGAGGGREAQALHELGYRVTAFEPVAALARALAATEPFASSGGVFRAAYQDLPVLRGVDGNTIELHDLGRFDAAIFGWGSISCVPKAWRRADALARIASITDGPILISFFKDRRGPSAPHVLERAAARMGVERGDWFDPVQGFVHEFAAGEVDRLARQAKLRIVHFDESQTPDNQAFPHAVLTR